MQKKIFLLGFVLLLKSFSFSQNAIQPTTATFFEGGINSPWAMGLDYDIGFAKVLSFNMQLSGGINSQVNRISTFGDVFFGEIQMGPRIYMNKIDTWEGVYLATVLRVGIYNIPFRTQESKLILSRANALQYGVGIYLGYRWTRKLVDDMSGLPFVMVLEPYLGWTLDFFQLFQQPPNFAQSPNNINRFTVGLTFKIGFYTHKKSKATLLAEEQASLEKQEGTNSQSITNNN